MEAQRCVGTLAYSAIEARTLAGEAVPMEGSASGAGKLGVVIRVPYGIVAAISPFNFPLNLVAHKLAPAIAAGCPVVLKPASQTPLSAVKLAAMLVDECGLPGEFLHVVTGGGGTVGNAIVEHPDIARLRRTTPALIAGDYHMLHPHSQDYLAFLRHDEATGQTCLVILNFSDQEQAVIFEGTSRDQLREMYRSAWRKFRGEQLLSPLEKQIVAVISEHPEYRVIIESAAADLANYSPRSGQLNPWLHMGLHLAIREQVATNRPPGIAEIHGKLAAHTGGAHEAEHRIIEVLAEQLWEAQRSGKSPDEAAYLERLRGLT